MKNNYNYDDPDYIYTDKSTGVLRNLYGITDERALHRIESQITAERLESLREKPIVIQDMETIKRIHKYLFGSIYQWAGEFRTVNMDKGATNFFEVENFRTAIALINNQIKDFKLIPKNQTNQISESLATLLESLNYFHPFREGNGRTQRATIEFLAKEKEYQLNLNPPDNLTIYEDYRKGTINGDIALLTKLISANLLSPVQSKLETSLHKQTEQTKPLKRTNSDPRYE
jgi:cell filamentation protein